MHFALKSVAIACALGAACAITSQIRTANKLQIETRSGHRIVAEVDERTTTDRLYFRYSSGSTVLIKSISWTQVISIRPIMETSQVKRMIPDQWFPLAGRKGSLAELAHFALMVPVPAE